MDLLSTFRKINMVRKTVAAGVLFLIFACTEQEKRNAKSEVTDTETTTQNDDIANEAREWLMKNITNYFATEELGSLDSFMQKMTTAEYYEYKNDATNVDLEIDGSLTETQFHAGL